jgi:hypothetical protein
VIKYKRQHDNYSCGAVAIENYYRYLGKKSPKNIKKKIKCKPRLGSYSDDIAKFFKKRAKYLSKFSEVTFFIDKGPCIIAYGGHFVFCPYSTKKYFYAANDWNERLGTYVCFKKNPKYILKKFLKEEDIEIICLNKK